MALSTCYLTECPHIMMAGLPPETETLFILMTKPQIAHSIPCATRHEQKLVTKSNLHSRREDLDSAFWRKKTQRICEHALILPALGKNLVLHFWHQMEGVLSHTNILQFFCGQLLSILQIGLILLLTGVSARLLRLRTQYYKTATTSDTNLKSRLSPMLLTNHWPQVWSLDRMTPGVQYFLLWI
jgi:hypothetical protein